MDMGKLDNLSEEAKAKALAAKTPEEMLEVAKSEGVELSLDELDGASGGRAWNEGPCSGKQCDEFC